MDAVEYVYTAVKIVARSKNASLLSRADAMPGKTAQKKTQDLLRLMLSTSNTTERRKVAVLTALIN